MISIKSKKAIEIMEVAGRIVGETLNLIEKNIRVGISTAELDRIAEDYIRSCGAIPSFKGYGGFPSTICASVNEVIVHGFPRENAILKDGDIISVDVGAIYRGYHGDAARTFPVGNVSEDKLRLIEVTKQCFFEGLKHAIPGNRLGDISHAIQVHAEKNGYSVVRELVGHGIGRDLHEDPNVPNFGYAGFGPELKVGMCLAIEPMINIGKKEVVFEKNGWEVRTKDRKCSAHYENTIAFTEDGVKILTLV